MDKIESLAREMADYISTYRFDDGSVGNVTLGAGINYESDFWKVKQVDAVLSLLSFSSNVGAFLKKSKFADHPNHLKFEGILDKISNNVPYKIPLPENSPLWDIETFQNIFDIFLNLYPPKIADFLEIQTALWALHLFYSEISKYLVDVPVEAILRIDFAYAQTSKVAGGWIREIKNKGVRKDSGYKGNETQTEWKQKAIAIYKEAIASPKSKIGKAPSTLSEEADWLMNRYEKEHGEPPVKKRSFENLIKETRKKEQA